MPIESRGRRDPALAAMLRGEGPPVQLFDYFVGRRALKVGAETRQPGDPIPEAADWPRLESWIRSGAVEQRLRAPEPVAAPIVEAPPAPAVEKPAAPKPPAAVEEKPAPAKRVSPKTKTADGPVLRPPRTGG